MSRAAAGVRNPLVMLPEAAALRALPPESRAAVRALFKGISRDARVRAEQSWRKHKGPMAAYWKAVAVYARHASVLLRDEPPRGRQPFDPMLDRFDRLDRSGRDDGP